MVLLVGGILGLIFLGISIELSGHDIPPDDDFVPLFSVIFFAVGANILYTGGLFAEVLLWAVGRGTNRRFAPYAWSRGLLFMLALCFVPGVLNLPGVVDLIEWFVSAITG
jgi:hypothetical protein